MEKRNKGMKFVTGSTSPKSTKSCRYDESASKCSKVDEACPEYRS